MTQTSVFLIDLTLTLSICVGVVGYVAKHLKSLVVELCGTAERASFWLAFSNVSLVLIPLIFALDYRPEVAAGTPVVFAIANQLKYALIGFAVTLGLLALVLLSFLPREKPHAAART